MKKINCICVGASKCGTTALYSNLRSHPDISLPNDRKEIHFLISFLIEVWIGTRTFLMVI